MTSASDGARPKKRSHSPAVTGTRNRKPPGLPAPEITSGNPLQLLLSQRMREIGEEEQGSPLSYQQLVERGADRRGRPTFSKPTVGNILNGKTTRLTDPVIEGLARALDVDQDVVRQAARQASQVSYSLPPRVQKMSPEQWDQLLQYADFLLAQEHRRR